MDITLYGAATDVGRQRKTNEDSYFADIDAGLFLVADGMGGHLAGDVASALAIKAITDALYSGNALRDSIEDAHRAIRDAAKKNLGVAGMGTTIVALRLDGCDYEIAWVGDSRAYLYDGTIKLLTRDHSFVQRMVDAGALTSEEAKDHPDASILTQALGATDIEAVDVGTVTGRLFAGQKLLLCSDGLTSALDDDTIASILQQDGSEQEIVERLIYVANENGGEDNITAIQVPAPPEAPVKMSGKTTRPMDTRELNRFLADKNDPGFKKKIIIAASILFFLVVTFVAMFLFYHMRSDSELMPVFEQDGRIVPEALEQIFPAEESAITPYEDDAVPALKPCNEQFVFLWHQVEPFRQIAVPPNRKESNDA